MDFEKLEKSIQEIITLVEKFNERYREKCFEILLGLYLRKELHLEIEPEAEKEEIEGEEEEFLVPIDVRAFLQTYNIPEEDLQKLFLTEKNQIRAIYKITTTKKATAQIQIALLTALENAIIAPGNKFEFSVESVREQCKNRKVYDSANFKAHFRNNQRCFKSLDDEEHVELSADGLTELAEVISIVAKK